MLWSTSPPPLSALRHLVFRGKRIQVQGYRRTFPWLVNSSFFSLTGELLHALILYSCDQTAGGKWEPRGLWHLWFILEVVYSLKREKKKKKERNRRKKKKERKKHSEIFTWNRDLVCVLLSCFKGRLLLFTLSSSSGSFLLRFDKWHY